MTAVIKQLIPEYMIIWGMEFSRPLLFFSGPFHQTFICFIFLVLLLKSMGRERKWEGAWAEPSLFCD